MKPAPSNYQLLSELGGPHARVRFDGQLQGRGVTWIADIRALRLPDSAATHQFIEVGPATGPERLIHIGLDVASIDQATVTKTILMVRQWKGLAPGRHEFGMVHSG